LWFLDGFIPQEHGGGLQHQRKPIVEGHADKISQAPPSQDLVDAVYLDFSEAFGTVSHSILLERRRQLMA